MKVVVVGASGMMGSKIVRALERAGQNVGEASSRSGIDVLRGDGLDAAFANADVVIDATNHGSFGDGDALAFFKQAGRNLLKAAKLAGVRHYLALSVVGAERLVEMITSGRSWFRRTSSARRAFPIQLCVRRSSSSSLEAS